MTTREAKARAQAVHEAILDESARLHESIERGATAVLATAFGPHQVDRIIGDMWAMCYPVGSRPGAFTNRSFALCNDDAWADLLRQAGVSRHPLFER